ncbi:MAG: pyruvate kinase [Actinomycetota bacterium]
MRRTKIVATLGPATWGKKELRSLLEAGTDVVRVNLAHADPSQHKIAIVNAREQARELGRTVGVLADLPGPKMRTGPVSGGEVHLETGNEFVLNSGAGEGDERGVSTTVADLAGIVHKDAEVYLADGEIVLRVKKISGPEVITEILRGGFLRSRKGMHVPEAERKVQAFTSEDRTALEAAVRLKVDYVGLSFVRDATDCERAQASLPKRGHRPLILAKVETGSAVEHLDEIVSSADAVMVARGDLGIQLPLQQVPILQKRIIEACNQAGKPVITATQMLESMTHSPLPSRAEAADVANAVLDGTHALMLSEETAIGDYPAEAVTKMSEIAETAEAAREELVPAPLESHRADDRVSWAVAHAAVEAAEDLGVAAILCPTRSGSTPFRVAAFRPSMPIVGLSERTDTIGRLTLVWGVTPLKVDPAPVSPTAAEDVGRAAAAARRSGLVRKGDHVVVVAGTPGRRAGRTDYVRVVRID